MRRGIWRTSALLALSLALPCSGQVDDQPLIELREQVEEAKAAGDAALLLKAFMNLANEYSSNGNSGQALSAFEEMRTHAVQAGKVECEIEALVQIGRLHRSFCEYGPAIEKLSIGLELAQASASESMLTGLLSDIGKVYADAKDPLRAAEFLERALQRMDEEEAPGRYRILTLLGVVSTQLGKEEQALLHYERARDLAEEAVGGLDGVAAIMSAGIANISLAEYERAIEYILPAIQHYRTQNRKQDLAAGLVVLGVAYESSGLLAEAASVYEEACTLARESKAPGLESNALHSLAGIRSMTGDFEEAYVLAQQGLEIDQGRMRSEQQAILAEFRAWYGAREQKLEIASLEDEAQVADLRLERSHDQRLWLAILAAGILAAVTALGLRSRSRSQALARLKLTSSQLVNERDKLQLAVDEVSTLRGLLAICGQCSSIRAAGGEWVRLESFVGEETGASFTHGICEDCFQAQFPKS